MRNKTLRSLSLIVVLLSEPAGISINGRAISRLGRDLSTEASTFIAAVATKRVHASAAHPIQIADGPEEVPPATALATDGPEEVPPPIQIADGPEEVPPAAALIADGPEEVPPAVQIADGPEEVPPAAVLIADGPEEVPPAIRIADGPEEVPPSISWTA